MGKKAQPRRGFTGQADVVHIPVDIVEYIHQKTRVSLHSPLDDQLMDCLEVYLSTESIIDGAPRLSEIRAALKEVQELAEPLANVLGQLDILSMRELRTRGVDIPMMTKGLQHLFYSTSNAIDELKKDKGGRPAKEARRVCITSLAKIYEGATGQKPTIAHAGTKGFYGRFYKFAEACFNGIGSPFGNETLGGAIQKALEKRP